MTDYLTTQPYIVAKVIEITNFPPQQAYVMIGGGLLAVALFVYGAYEVYDRFHQKALKRAAAELQNLENHFFYKFRIEPRAHRIKVFDGEGKLLITYTQLRNYIFWRKVSAEGEIAGEFAAEAPFFKRLPAHEKFELLQAVAKPEHANGQAAPQGVPSLTGHRA